MLEEFDPKQAYQCTPHTKSKRLTKLMFMVINAKYFSAQQVTDHIAANPSELNKRNKYGHTALFLACRNSSTTSSIEMVRALVQAGADLEIGPKCRTPGHRTPLLAACRFSATDSSLETVKVLIGAGAKVNPLSYRKSPLSVTCYSFNENWVHTLEIIELLVLARANINYIDCNGYVPICIMSRFADDYHAPLALQVISALLDAGAYVKRAFIHLSRNWSPAAATVFGLLLERGVHMQTIDGIEVFSDDKYLNTEAYVMLRLRYPAVSINYKTVTPNIINEVHKLDCELTFWRRLYTRYILPRIHTASLALTLRPGSYRAELLTYRCRQEWAPIEALSEQTRLACSVYPETIDSRLADLDRA